MARVERGESRQREEDIQHERGDREQAGEAVVADHDDDHADDRDAAGEDAGITDKSFDPQTIDRRSFFIIKVCESIGIEDIVGVPDGADTPIDTLPAQSELPVFWSPLPVSPIQGDQCGDAFFALPPYIRFEKSIGIRVYLIQVFPL